MAQHDYNIANDGAAAVRSDINNALSAIVSNNSGATEPSTTFAYQWWYDTSTNILKQRNSANDAWISVLTLDQTGDLVASMTSTDLTVSRALTNEAMRLVPGYVENLSMSLSGGVLTIKGGDGNDLSATNPAYVCTLSNVTAGKPVLHTITSNQTLTEGDIDNNLLGFPTSVAVADDVTLGVYLVANDSDASPTFMISRNLFAKVTPAAANIGAPDDSIADAFGDFFSFSNIDETTYNGNACELVGLIRAQMDASDAWTIQALDNEKDGFGNFTKAKQTPWEFISSADANSDSVIDFNLPKQYKIFKIIFNGVRPSSNGRMYARTSSDGGTTFDSSAGDYYGCTQIFFAVTQTQYGAISSGSETEISFTDVARSNASGFCGEMRIYNATNSGKQTTFVYDGAQIDTSGTAQVRRICSGWVVTATEVNDAIRFFMASGSISSGSFYVYGNKDQE